MCGAHKRFTCSLRVGAVLFFSWLLPASLAIRVRHLASIPSASVQPAQPAQPANPLSLYASLGPHPLGCPDHTVYIETSVWWTTDQLSSPNATNYGRVKMQSCWPHLDVFRDTYPMYPVTSVESRTASSGSLAISRLELAYQTSAWLDPCPFKYWSWAYPNRGYGTCAQNNGTVLAPGADTWASVGKTAVTSQISGQLSGWVDPSGNTSLATGVNPGTMKSVPYSQVCPQEANKSYTAASSASSAASSLAAAQAGSCAPNCPFCNPQLVNSSGMIRSYTSELAAPVVPGGQVGKCVFVDKLSFNTNRYPTSQVAQDSGFFVYPRLYLENPLETALDPPYIANGDGKRQFELVTGFGMIMYKSPGAVNVKKIQPFHYNRHDGNEVSSRVNAPSQGSTSAYIRPAWRLPIYGKLHWFLRVYDCSTDHGGSAMERWTLAVNADPENGVAGYVIAQGNMFWTGMVHLDPKALGLQSGWYSLVVTIRARDPDTNAIKTTIHRHWFQILADFPSKAYTPFIVYPNANIRGVTNYSDVDPRPNVLDQSSVHVGTHAVSYPKTQWTQQFRTLMTYDFTGMTRRCGFQSVTLYLFMKRSVTSSDRAGLYGLQVAMPVAVNGTTVASFVTADTTRLSFNNMAKSTTQLGQKAIGLRQDVQQWHGIPLDVTWFNKNVKPVSPILHLVIHAPIVMDQEFYFATVQDTDLPKPGPGYQPFLYFVPNC